MVSYEFFDFFQTSENLVDVFLLPQIFESENVLFLYAVIPHGLDDGLNALDFGSNADSAETFFRHRVERQRRHQTVNISYV